MNRMERVLCDDLARAMDRLSLSIPEGALAATPMLHARLQEMDARLAAERGRLLEGYARWTRALDDLENVCALALWRSTAEEAVESAEPRAA